MTRPAFEASLAALRDNVVMAIERREMGVVQDGLDVYQRLIETVLDEQLALQAATAGESSVNLPLGREWDQILRDLHGVIDSTSASTSRLLWTDVLSWVRRAAVTCADRGVLNALATVLTLFESAWSQELASPSGDTTARQDALLLRLSEFGSIYLHLGRTDENSSQGAEVIYTRTFLQMIKQAIEAHDPEAARVGLKYFLHGSASPGSPLTPVTGAGLLSIYAWILYRLDHGEQDDSFEAVRSQIVDAFEEAEALIPVLRASDDLERELGVHWWELRERGPMSSGVIQIGTYISLALILVGMRHLAWEALNPASNDDVDAARRLMTVIDSFEKGSFAGTRAALDLPDSHFDRLKEHLSSVVDQGDAILEESYARLPVDPQRVEAFRTAVRERLAKVRNASLTNALLVAPTSTAEPVQPNFGLDSLIPRWYFADTRVFADPERLADELVRALVRGEEDRILDLMVTDLSGVAETSLGSLAASLDEAIAAGSVSTPVVVTNSYEAHALLVGHPRGVVEESSAPFTAGKVIRVHDDRSPYVALLAPGRVQLLPPAPHIGGDEVLDDLAVIVGVSELPPDEMNEIVGHQKRARIDEARLRGSLRIRLLEHLKVAKQSDLPPVIWTLPESSW